VELCPLQHILFVSTSQIQLRTEVAPCVVRPTTDFHLKTKRVGNGRVLNSSPRGICTFCYSGICVFLQCSLSFNRRISITRKCRDRNSLNTQVTLRLVLLLKCILLVLKNILLVANEIYVIGVLVRNY